MSESYAYSLATVPTKQILNKAKPLQVFYDEDNNRYSSIIDEKEQIYFDSSLIRDQFDATNKDNLKRMFWVENMHIMRNNLETNQDRWQSKATLTLWTKQNQMGNIVEYQIQDSSLGKLQQFGTAKRSTGWIIVTS